MKKILLTWMFCLGISTALASECTVGYEPPLSVYYVTQEHLSKSMLPESDRVVVEGKISSFLANKEGLATDYRNKKADIVMALSFPEPDRAKIDLMVDELLEMLRKINELNISYAGEMKEVFQSAALKKLRISGVKHQATCDESRIVPEMRQILTARVKKQINFNDDEKKYLDDFSRREKYFTTEKNQLLQRLDKSMRSKMIDQSQVKALRSDLIGLIKQQIILRLDRYFYADNVLFSSGRADKANSK